jgi:peroxiredoxin
LRGYPVVLIFYPLDWEPVTREQLSLYQAYLPQFGQFDAFLLGISVDPVSSHEAFARDVGIDFPLLSDPDPKGAVSRLYGVYRKAFSSADEHSL